MVETFNLNFIQTQTARDTDGTSHPVTHTWHKMYFEQWFYALLNTKFHNSKHKIDTVHYPEAV
jgi:hypothetical protein